MITNSSQVILRAEPGTPISVAELRRVSGAVLPTNPTEDMIEYLGWAVVHPRTPPAGDGVVEPAAPVLEDGKYYQNWVLRPYSQDELDNRLAQQTTAATGELISHINTLLINGVAFDLGENTYHINIEADSFTRLSVLVLAAQRAVERGDAEATVGVAVTEGEYVQVPAADFVLVFDTLTDRYEALMRAQWEWLGVIRDQTTLEDVRAKVAEAIAVIV